MNDRTLPTCLELLTDAKARGKKQWALLIDPDKALPASVAHRLQLAHEAGVSYIFVGGSFLSHYGLSSLIGFIKEHTDRKVLLFPGNAMQVVPEADALLFLNLISGRNPEYLIGQHVAAAPLLQKMDLEVIPTGYMLVDAGKPTSASYISGTLPLPNDKPDLAAYTALAGQYLGLKVAYLDAGSGAQTTVSPETIRKVSETLTIPVIVGGGIKSLASAESLIEAGADVLVVGTALESGTNNSELRLLGETLRRYS
jgi:putative glycerol-1-phosphate prenyltransferase